MQPNQQEAITYYPWFDWLRFFLALTVCLYHNGTFTWHSSGNFAVQVFFALSGWLIGNILLNTEKSDLPRFYFNRALRIWVPYFFALGLLVAASLLHDPITPKWLEIVFYKITFVYNLFAIQQLDTYKSLFPLQGTGNHFWSVNAEEQFYLLSPLLLVLLPARFGKNILTWVFIAICAIISQTYASIVLGVFCAVIVKKFGSFYLTNYSRIAFCFVLLITTFLMYKPELYMLCAPFCAICIVMLLAVQGRQSALGKIAGGISYPLYMNAWVVGITLNFIFKHLHIDAPLTMQIINPIVSVIFATIIYWFVDKKVLAMRSALYTPARAQAITFIAYASVFIGICGGFAMQLNPAAN